MLADMTTWHRSWWTFTGCGCHNASNTNCLCSCIVASAEQRHDTRQNWQRPSVTLAVVNTVRRRLRSASSTDLIMPVARHSTIGDRMFAVVGPKAWNSLPHTVRSSATCNTFKKNLKSHLFGLSYSLWQLCTLTMFSTLVVVNTTYCTLQIVLLTLHYKLD